MINRRELLFSAVASPFAGAGRSFADRILPAPVNGGFRMDGYWVWCGSVIRGEDQRYHMFASRWPKSVPFGPHWCTNSEVVRASADKPEGPYRFEEIVLPPRGAEFWDGRMTHNPTIHRWRDNFLLFYIGTTYKGDTPSATENRVASQTLWHEARANQRIGLAVSKSNSTAPWKRMPDPILQPRPGKWDALMTTKPRALYPRRRQRADDLQIEREPGRSTAARRGARGALRCTLPAARRRFPFLISTRPATTSRTHISGAWTGTMN